MKTILRAIPRTQIVPEEVLHAVQLEANPRPLGYISSGAADPDPAGPNHLLVGITQKWNYRLPARRTTFVVQLGRNSP